MSITVQLSSGRAVSVESDSALVGRDPSCDIALPDERELHPRHARIKKVANKWMIESEGDWPIQVGSGVPGRKLWLSSGDTIRLTESGPEIVFFVGNIGTTPPHLPSINAKPEPVSSSLPPPIPIAPQGSSEPCSGTSAPAILPALAAVPTSQAQRPVSHPASSGTLGRLILPLCWLGVIVFTIFAVRYAYHWGRAPEINGAIERGGAFWNKGEKDKAVEEYKTVLNILPPGKDASLLYQRVIDYEVEKNQNVSAKQLVELAQGRGIELRQVNELDVTSPPELVPPTLTAAKESRVVPGMHVASRIEASSPGVGDTHAGHQSQPSRSSSASPATPDLAEFGGSDLPSDISRQKTWPDLPLMQMALRLSQEKTDFRAIRASVSFSPKGNFVVVVYETPDHRPQDIRLWHVASGKQRTAKSSDCDYFSFPAAFSPDETSIACMDGDFVRIWDLNSSPASLVQSVSVNQLTSHINKIAWNPASIQWPSGDTILLRVHDGEPVRYHQVLRKQADRMFLPIGPIRSIGRHHDINGETSWFSDSAVSPNGLYWAVVGYPGDGIILQVRDPITGKNIKMARFPHRASTQPPSTVLAFLSGSTGPAYGDPDSALEFSPRGKYVLLASLQNITVLKTKSWQEVAVISCQGPEVFRPYCLSPDEKYLAGIAVRSTRTSRGEKLQRFAVVFDLASGQRLQHIDLNEEFSSADDAHSSGRSAHETVTFANNGKRLLIGVADETLDKKQGRTKGSLAIASWDLPTAQRHFVVKGRAPFVPSFALSPNEDIAITQVGNTLQVWDLPHLAKVLNDLSQGDKSWEAGKHSEAFKHYCALLGDKMAWFVEDSLPRAWSRCIDVYAEAGDVANGRKLVSYTQTREISVAAETPQGQKLVHDFLNEQCEAMRRKAQQQSEAEARRLAEVRAKNQKNSVVACRLTKRRFIEKMKEIMRYGRLDDLVTQCIFEDYAFQDTFGDPDSNVEWEHSKRLILYRCIDGAIQLTVTYLGPRTFVTEINQY